MNSYKLQSYHISVHSLPSIHHYIQLYYILTLHRVSFNHLSQPRIHLTLASCLSLFLARWPLGILYILI